MAIFSFDVSYSIGKVRAVDTRRVVVQVNSDEDLRKARVGQLVTLQLPGAIEEWLIGIIDKVIKTPASDVDINDDESDSSISQESIMNTVLLTLVGTVGLSIENKTYFSRSLI